MTPSEITIYRLHNQQLEHSRFKKPGELVKWLGGVQGQDYAGGKWSIGLRLPESTDAGIEESIADKILVRTWAMRGTLHFVAASDIHWLLELLAPRIIASNARRYRELELDDETLARSNTVLKNTLQGGNELNRSELLAILEQNGISTQGQRAAYMLQRASLDSLICQGIAQRNNPTYMSIPESLPQAKTMERDEALAELAERYFKSRGPATLKDFVWWSGLLVADARAGLEAVKSKLVPEKVENQTYWRSQSVFTVPDSSPGAHLLPSFDEYLIGYRDRSASLHALQAKNINLGNRFSPTIALDGRIVGTWKRVFRKGAVVITTELFTTLTNEENQTLSAALSRYGEFLDMPVLLK